MYTIKSLTHCELQWQKNYVKTYLKCSNIKVLLLLTVLLNVFSLHLFKMLFWLLWLYRNANQLFYWVCWHWEGEIFWHWWPTDFHFISFFRDIVWNQSPYLNKPKPWKWREMHRSFKVLPWIGTWKLSLYVFSLYFYFFSYLVIKKNALNNALNFKLAWNLCLKISLVIQIF